MKMVIEEVKLPDGITNIDKIEHVETDYLLCPEYALHIVNHLRVRSIIEPTCGHAQGAHMHHFPSDTLSVCH